MQYRSCGQAYDPYNLNKATIDNNKRYNEWLRTLNHVKDKNRIKLLHDDKTVSKELSSILRHDRSDYRRADGGVLLSDILQWGKPHIKNIINGDP